METIFTSYKYLKSIGCVVKQMPKLEKKFFHQILEGKCDLKMMVYHIMSQKDNIDLNDDIKYTL